MPQSGRVIYQMKGYHLLIIIKYILYSFDGIISDKLLYNRNTPTFPKSAPKPNEIFQSYVVF